MAQLDDALDRMQEALDDEDLELVCAVASLILAICGVAGRGAGGAAAVAVEDVEGDAIYDPDELGLDPETFDVPFWRKMA